MFHRIIKYIVTIFIVFLCVLILAPSFAWAASESESNNSLNTANQIQPNSTTTGKISSKDDIDWFKIQLSSAGMLTIQFSHQNTDYSIDTAWGVFIYDSAGDLIGDPNRPWYIDGNQKYLNIPDLGLAKGTYYIKITSGWQYIGDEYTLKISYTASSTAEMEPNNGRETSTSMNLNTVYTGTLWNGSDQDWYKFSINQDSTVSIKLTHQYNGYVGSCWGIMIYNSDTSPFYIGDQNSWWSPGNTTVLNLSDVKLSKGTYYLVVKPSRLDTTPYTIEVSIPVKNGWIQENGGWYYYDNGILLKNSWISYGGFWYYLGSNGKMQTNAWVKDNGYTYYVDANGKMASGGWKQISGSWYYFNKWGEMYNNEWLNYNGTWCHFDTDGKMQTNAWVKDSGYTYYVDANGKMASGGWMQISGSWYSFNKWGEMYNNEWLNYNGSWYHFDTDGKMQTNAWVKDSGYTYYVDANGKMASGGWMQISGSWYYFNKWGEMYNNEWLNYNGTWYYFDASGKMVTNAWITYKGVQYHFNASGACDRSA